MTNQPIDPHTDAFGEDPGDWIDDLGYSNPNMLLCTDPACPGTCGADNHSEGEA